MPAHNHFAHQRYTDERPAAPYERLSVDVLPPVGSPRFLARMNCVGRALEAANVGAVVLVHGTFVGNDPIGLNAMLVGHLPNLYHRICSYTKRTIDVFCGDIGNYTKRYAELFASAMGAERNMLVQRVFWSGMNNHAGRAVAAVQLIGYLSALGLASGKRIVICGHSHGANAMALMTNLLAARQDVVKQFLDATGRYARAFDNSWARLCEIVTAEQRPLADTPLDLVTMGMPIRYGFDTEGFSRLLHFVYHRPGRRRAEYRTAPPRSFFDVLNSRQGDYVQQFGIAGSNFSTPVHWPCWTADRQLARQLSPGLSCFDLFKRVRVGMRIPQEGRTLLVDYQRPQSQWLPNLFGHGVYTHYDLMLFHAEQIVRCFYQ